ELTSRRVRVSWLVDMRFSSTGGRTVEFVQPSGGRFEYGVAFTSCPRGGVEDQEGNVGREERGFASMGRGKQKEMASKGGRAAHEKGTAHEWTSEEAREAGRKGGMASHRRRTNENEYQPPSPEQSVEDRRI